MSQFTIIDPSVELHETATLGHFCVIGKNVRIGEGCVIGSHVVIHDDVTIGNFVRIDDHTVIGKQPMRAAISIFKDEGKLPGAVIGDHCMIGASVVIYTGCKLDEKILVADLATIREEVTIGEKTIVGRGVAIENKCSIGAFVKLETNVYITAISTVEDRVFVAPMVCTTNDNYMGRTKERFNHFGGCTFKKGSRIGGNAVILPGVTIAEDAQIAAGAIVTKDIPANQTWAGVPARYFRDVPEEEKLENQ
jgi:acetyltransferase-like isoleucine patch superfamily enzyme